MKKTILFLLTSLFVASSSQVIANEISSFDSILALIHSKRVVKDSNVLITPTIKEKKWFESFAIRGYAQVANGTRSQLFELESFR